jgi:hypothetical protein
MQYTILGAVSLPRLSELVNKYMHEGWKPLGGVALGTYEEIDDIYVQAMIRE